MIPHQSSADALLCVPIGNRFQFLSTHKLDPVLVSQSLPPSPSPVRSKPAPASALPSSSLDTWTSSSGEDSITHCITDASLSITVVAHGATGVSLYHRTRPVSTLSLLNPTAQTKHHQRWSVQSLLHLGRVPMPVEEAGEKQGTMENVVLVAAILAADPRYHDDESDSEEDREKFSSCCGQVLVLIASRNRLWIHNRIPLTTLAPTFVPTVALHPATYLNKIVLGGWDQLPLSNQKKKRSQRQRKQVRPVPTLLLLNVRSGKLVHRFTCLPLVQHSTITTLAQSPAMDTIAVGTDRGMVHLINLKQDCKLFSLRHASSATTTTSIRDQVTITSISFRTDGAAMQYGIAPMAVGRSDGKITVWDLTPPERTDDDGDDNDHHDAMSSSLERTILCELDAVHKGGVAMLQYLPQEPLLVSVGTQSNAVLIHIFDSPDHTGRILRQRRGHTAPPCYIRYLHSATAGGVRPHDGTDARACQILSSGGPDRSLRVFSTARTVLDKEYSQGRGLEKKAKQFGLNDVSELLLPPLLSLATCDSRSRDWGDLVTIHENHSMAYVWSTKRGAQSGPVLKQRHWNVSAMKVPPPPETHATSVTLSACGNFALVGTKGGIIYRYNVQSGQTRGSYPRGEDGLDEQSRRKKLRAPGDIRRTVQALEKNMKISNQASNLDRVAQTAEAVAKQERLLQAKLARASHKGAAVTGLAVDSLNKTVISVGADRKLILWNFSTHAPHQKCPYDLPAAATMLCHVRDSNLAAIALDDFSVLLLDCTLLSIVRRFGAQGSESRHTDRVTDLGFSPDGRTLFTSSLDRTIRVYDVPTNTCVDWMRFQSAPTSLTVSPTGEFLATTHVGQRGISVWSDRSFYQTVHVDKASLSQPVNMDQPIPISENADDATTTTKTSADMVVVGGKKRADNDMDEDAGPVEPKRKGLVTLSGLPAAHWKNLFHLELVKERNKPTEPPKKPPSAPFFLQWRSGQAMGGDDGEGGNTEKAGAINHASPEVSEKWAAAWSDEDEDAVLDGQTSQTVRDQAADVASTDAVSKVAPSTTNANEAEITVLKEAPTTDSADKKLAGADKKEVTKAAFSETEVARSKRSMTGPNNLAIATTKKRKVTHYRSKLASILETCRDTVTFPLYQAATDHIASLGPSAIDIELSSLCNGTHDLDDGLPLLHLAALWLTECCETRERFEVVNAYLHRFLHLHSSILIEVEQSLQNDSTQIKSASEAADEESSELTAAWQSRKDQRLELLRSISKLKENQREAFDALEGKMQHSLCLLRHFSRMV